MRFPRACGGEGAEGSWGGREWEPFCQHCHAAGLDGPVALAGLIQQGVPYVLT